MIDTDETKKLIEAMVRRELVCAYCDVSDRVERVLRDDRYEILQISTVCAICGCGELSVKRGYQTPPPMKTDDDWLLDNDPPEAA